MSFIKTTAATLTALATLAAAGVASAQTSVRPGQTVNGDLSSRDARLSDDSYFDCYRVQTSAGRSYTVTMSSTAFDTYLARVAGNVCDANAVEGNDDGPNMGTNSSLTFSGDGQTFLFRANSLSASETGAYTFTVAESGGAGPSRPIGKPPAGGGGSAPPANNNSGGNAGAFAGLSRPTDPEERYTWDSMCSGVDTVALMISSEGMSDEALMAWVNSSSILHNAAVASGRAIGKTEEEVTNDAADFGAAYFQDETLFDDVPPLEVRAACLAVAPR